MFLIMFQLLLNHVPLLVTCLKIPNSSQTILAALVDVVSVDARPFASCLSDLEDAISRQPSLLGMALKIFGAVGRLNQVGCQIIVCFSYTNLVHKTCDLILKTSFGWTMSITLP